MTSIETDRGFVLNLFPELATPFPIQRCPLSIQQIATGIHAHFNTPLEAVAVVALALAATAIGPSRIVRHNRADLTALFNVMIAHTGTRELPWFHLLQSRLVQHVVAMQRALSKNGVEGTHRLIAQRLSDLDAARRSNNPPVDLIEIAITEIAQLKARLKPEIILGLPSPAEITAATPNSFDTGLWLTSLGSDPLDDLSVLTPADRRLLATWLNTQWAGAELPQAAQPGKLSILWSTRTTSLRHLAHWREFHSGSMPIPLLILTSLDEPIPVPEKPLPCEAGWETLIDEAFKMRCHNHEQGYFIDPAQPLFQDFQNDIARHLEQVPEVFRNHITWLPTFAPKLALLFHILNGESERKIPRETAENAVAVARWIGGKHLQSLVAALPISSNPPVTDTTASTDDPQAANRMLQKIRDNGPISRRNLRRTYNRPREQGFDITLDALLATGAVKLTAKKQLFVPESGGAATGGDGKSTI